MTRFDEALQRFARDAEPQMGAQVSVFANRYSAEQQIGRGRARRTALAVTTAVVTVGLVGGAAWAVPNFSGRVDPAVTPDAPTHIPYLGTPGIDGPIRCFAPLPPHPGGEVVSTDPSLEVPQVDAEVRAKVLFDPVPAEFGPDAPELGEDYLAIDTQVAWEGDEPSTWGVNVYAVLLDANGNVVNIAGQKSVLTEGGGPVEYFGFQPFECDSAVERDAEPLDGPYTLSTITHVWVGDPQSPVIQFRDAGLPQDATLTFNPEIAERDWEEYWVEHQENKEAVKEHIEGEGTTVADIAGTGASPATALQCEVNDKVIANGLEGVAAVAIDLPTVELGVATDGVNWERAAGEAPWWGDAGHRQFVFIDANGEVAGAAQTQGATGGLESARWVNRARWDTSAEACGGAALPQDPGQYQVYMVTQSAYVPDLDAPPWLAERGGFEAVDLWVPVGVYVVE